MSDLAREKRRKETDSDRGKSHDEPGRATADRLDKEGVLRRHTHLDHDHPGECDLRISLCPPPRPVSDNSRR